VGAGDLHATVKHNAGGQPIIQISQQDSLAAVEPALSVSGAENSKTLDEEHVKQLRELLPTTFTEDGKNIEVVLPASVLPLYLELLSEQLSRNTDAAWLVAELAKRGMLSKVAQEDKTVILGHVFGNKPAGQAETMQNLQKGGTETLVKGAVKHIPVSRKLGNSVKSENDDIVVGMLEEEGCDSGIESTDDLRTSSDSENEDKQLGHGSDEL
jgi:hypothetical protein